jgi:hypothetical protein
MPRKEREVKTALKDYENVNDEDKWSKYNTCEKEYEKHLDEWKMDGGNKKRRDELLTWTEIWNKNLK